MLVNLNKNIFYFLLILSINYIIISSYSEEFPFYDGNQNLILKDACENKNPIFCSMFSAIEDIFSSIQNEEIQLNDEAYCENLCIEYENIYARDIICDTTETQEFGEDENNLFAIKFSNCNVLIEGKISYQNSDISKIDFGNFLSELTFDYIIFNLKNGILGELEAEFSNNTKKYNYNKKNAIFASQIVNMTEKMDVLMNKVFDNYKAKIIEKITINFGLKRILAETINIFKDQFTYFDGPKILSEEKNVTYIAYNKFEYNLFVHINNKIFFPYMLISFEYALNHNIFYQEGYFMIENFVFEEDTKQNNRFSGYGYKISSKYPQFDDKYNNDIWNTIINDFKNKLNKYRTR